MKKITLPTTDSRTPKLILQNVSKFRKDLGNNGKTGLKSNGAVPPVGLEQYTAAQN